MSKAVDLSSGRWRVRFDPSQYVAVAESSLMAGATGFDGRGDVSLPRYAYQAIALYFNEGRLSYLGEGSETFWRTSAASNDHIEVFFYDSQFWTEPLCTARTLEGSPEVETLLQPRDAWLRARATSVARLIASLLSTEKPVATGLRSELNTLLIDLED